MKMLEPRSGSQAAKRSNLSDTPRASLDERSEAGWYDGPNDRGKPMHEMALAEAVVAAAIETAEKNGIARITRIEVRVGELQRIDRDSFRFAIEQLIPPAEPRIAGAVLDVRGDPATFLCRRCGRSFGLDDAPSPGDRDASEAIHFVPELAHAYLRCPGCASPDFEVTAGRGVMLGAIEGD